MATIKKYTTADAYINESSPTTNYGTHAILCVYQTATNHRRSFLKFDTTLNAKSITSATLYVYAIDLTGTITVSIYKITSTWAENTVTWNAPPTLDGTLIDSKNITSSGAWYTFNVTSLFTGWWNSTITNYGLVLREPGANGANATNIASKEYATSDYHPYILVDYVPKPKGGFSGVSNPYIFFKDAFENNKKLWKGKKLLLPKDLGFEY